MRMLNENRIVDKKRKDFVISYFAGYRKILKNEKLSLSEIERLYESYSKAANNRNKEFELALIEFENIKLQDCIYCGSNPSPYNGIDRKDNTKGYIITNCQPCCTSCNMMKHTLSHAEFINKIKLIYNKHVN